MPYFTFAPQKPIHDCRRKARVLYTFTHVGKTSDYYQAEQQYCSTWLYKVTSSKNKQDQPFIPRELPYFSLHKTHLSIRRTKFLGEENRKK